MGAGLSAGVMFSPFAVPSSPLPNDSSYKCCLRSASVAFEACGLKEPQIAFGGKIEPGHALPCVDRSRALIASFLSPLRKSNPA